MRVASQAMVPSTHYLSTSLFVWLVRCNPGRFFAPGSQFSILIAQGAALHLAGCIAGKLSAELDSPWRFVGCYTRATPCDQLAGQFFRRGETCTRLDKGDDALSPLLVRNPNNSHVGDGGSLHHPRLDFCWIDVHTA